MSADTLVVAAIVIGAVAYLVRHFVRARRAAKSGPDCDNCGH
ncbi:MAG: FeoB-associated Cys-rich membrane protein [Gemmatimonadaceae bacterium]|nr:FeoB-associated Cys-rich membrane protein [Gemmatimonadaceae bacterium]MCW5826824.1 FeoB-associated Cys-rich membrane protein [Gemmatimonadaceae bacterium]